MSLRRAGDSVIMNFVLIRVVYVDFILVSSLLLFLSETLMNPWLIFLVQSLSLRRLMPSEAIQLPIQLFENFY